MGPDYCVMCDEEFFSWRECDDHCGRCRVFNNGYNAHRSGKPCDAPANGLTEYGVKLWNNGYKASANILEDQRQDEIRREIEIRESVERLIEVGTNPAADRKQFALDAKKEICEISGSVLERDPSEAMIEKQAKRLAEQELEEFRVEAEQAIEILCGSARGVEAASLSLWRRSVLRVGIVISWPFSLLALGRKSTLPHRHPDWRK